MVGMTFLGAAVVTRRNQHLRMDVLVRFMPAPVAVLLRVAEQLLLVVLAGFVLSQSYFYAGQMLRIGRTSDMAGVPMWIPHGAVALGFALILDHRALARCDPACARPRAGARRPRRRGQDMTFALAVVPVVLLLLGFPIFIVLLTAVTVALVFFMQVPLVVAAPEPVRLDQRHAAARGAVLHLCRRADGARQRRAAAGRFRAGRRRLGARQPRRDHGRHLGDLRRDLRRERRDAWRPSARSCCRRCGAPAIRRPSPPGLITVGRRDRHHHPAQHPDDRLRRGRRGIGAAALCGRRASRAC